MKFVDEDAAPVAFTASDDALPFQLGVEIAGLDGKLDVPGAGPSTSIPANSR